MVPEGTNRAASLPSSAATRSSRRLSVGSSLKTSSPTSAEAIAARIPAVGRVTVSLRRSIKLSGMVGPGLRLVEALQIPAPVGAAQADDAVVDVLEAHHHGRVDRLELAVLEEAPQALDRRRVKFGGRLLDQFLEAVRVGLDASVNPVRIGKLRKQVVDPLVLDGLEHRGEGLPGGALRVSLEVCHDLIAGGRLASVRRGGGDSEKDCPHHPNEEFDRNTHECPPPRYTGHDASIRQGNYTSPARPCLARCGRRPASHSVRPAQPRRPRHSPRSPGGSPKQSGAAFSDDFFSRLVLAPAPFERVPTDVHLARITP